MKTKLDPSAPNNQAQGHANFSVMMAFFRANKLVEILAALNNMLAIAAIVYSTNRWGKFVATSTLVAGLGVFYFALRIRIDYALFKRWDTLGIASLDEVLKELNPNFEQGRSLKIRLMRCYQLFKQGLAMLVLQFLLLIMLAWIFVPKVLN
ncbi:MAG: hypothetical protein WBP13_00270 [Methylophilaceae bacterium]